VNRAWWKYSSDLFAANIEAQQAIMLRMQKLAKGGKKAEREAQKMVSEKMLASIEAATTLATGGTPQKVLRRYRTLMRANGKRLSK